MLFGVDSFLSKGARNNAHSYCVLYMESASGFLQVLNLFLALLLNSFSKGSLDNGKADKDESKVKQVRKSKRVKNKQKKYISWLY